MARLPRWTADDAERALLRAGFTLIRSKGSHRIGFECEEHHDGVMGVQPGMFDTLPGAHPSMVAYERKRREEKTYR